MNFICKIEEYTGKLNMFSGGSILAAISGGGDSVALLHFLKECGVKYGFILEAAHLNHSLRGKESDKDENFCRDLCMELNIPLTVKKLAKGEISTSNSSFETAARNIRMSFLENLAVEKKISKIATGHNLDDQTETIFQRILRGTGPYGISGILPVRDEKWIRPLLCVTRKEIREYLKESGIIYREDSSNQNIDILRNKVRLKLIPYIENNFAPNVSRAISRLADLNRLQEEYITGNMLKAYSECLIHEDKYKILLDKTKLFNYHKLVKQRIFRHCLSLLEGYGRDTDTSEIENILDLTEKKHMKADVTSNIELCVEKNILTLNIKTGIYNIFNLELSGETAIPYEWGKIIVEKAPQNTFADGLNNIMLDSGIMEKYGKLTIGVVRSGELIMPFGMKKMVKISDILSSFSIPANLRKYYPVLRAGAVPIWIPGVKSSEVLRTEDKNYVNMLLLTYKNGILWTSNFRNQ